MDRSVNPGDDFYDFANGAWLRRTQVPADRSSTGVFDRLYDLASHRVASLIEGIARSRPQAGSERRKIADLYRSYLNAAEVERRELAPVRPQLDAIRAIRDAHDLGRALGRTLRADVDPLNNTNFHTDNLFGIWVGPGFHDPGRYHAYLLQGGLELPDRGYYLSGSEESRELVAKYRAHIAAMLALGGLDSAAQRAERIATLDSAIAATHRSLADNFDLHKADNPWAAADFTARAHGLDWTAFFDAAGLNGQDTIVVWQPEAVIGEAALVGTTPVDTWKDWLSYHLIEDYADVLPEALARERFALFGTVLRGAPQQRPRWQRGVALVNGLLGDAVGKAYARRYFSPRAKSIAQAMVSEILAAFGRRIDALSWMAPATKAQAKAKLANVYVGIGYPETWRDYAGYDVRADDLFGNVWRAGVFEYEYQRGMLGRPVDHRQWSMTPQTVNAVSLPLQVALNFPAAILEPPFFDPDAPGAANFGGIGTVIGHEISHFFDTESSDIDALGSLNNWWTPEDLAHFKAAGAALAAQYDQYRPFPDLAVSGELTSAENVADVAGISAALDGFHASLGRKAAPVQNGLSGDQQFFIAFAQNWMGQTRPAALRQQVLTDGHAPERYRAYEVRNIDAWYDAFGVRPGAKLYLPPGERVPIW